MAAAEGVRRGKHTDPDERSSSCAKDRLADPRSSHAEWFQDAASVRAPYGFHGGRVDVDGALSPVEWTGPWVYLGVFAATVIEGEVVFIAASALVGGGYLHPVGVFVAAALGGSVGDQMYFYVLRSQLKGRLDRFPAWTSRREQVLQRVAAHVSAMILACRFLPGLRIAIPAACAVSDVSGLRFSLLSLVSSLAWAGGIMGMVSWIGPAAFRHLGVNDWWASLLPAGALLALSWGLCRMTRDLVPPIAVESDRATGSVA